jgi:hypothetical protein
MNRERSIQLIARGRGGGGSGWGASIDPLVRREGLDLFGAWVKVHPAVAEAHPAGLVRLGDRVLEPVLLVALGVILVRAAALGAVHRGIEHDR